MEIDSDTEKERVGARGEGNGGRVKGIKWYKSLLTN